MIDTPQKALMLGHGGSSAGSYLADPTSPIPSHCAVITLFQSVSVHQVFIVIAHPMNTDRKCLYAAHMILIHHVFAAFFPCILRLQWMP